MMRTWRFVAAAEPQLRVRATHRVRAEDEFSEQHTAHEIADGQMLLFDKGVTAGMRRVIELRMTPDRATRGLDVVAAANELASAVSSARRLADGNTLVSFGTSGGRATRADRLRRTN